MNALTKKSLLKTRTNPGILSASLVLLLLAANVQATNLATEPFALKSSVDVRPNIMFVLDDSGSMNDDSLPDWAGPHIQPTSTLRKQVVIPAPRFFNSAFNGIAYNPAKRYDVPVTFTGGVVDTTKYPSMNGQSVANGGDASATAGTPNWRAVKVDGYGIQKLQPGDITNVDLEGAAFYFATIPGEYCTAVNLRTCQAAAAPSVSYPYPAPLRWCSTAAAAGATTATAGTSCQASNIEPAAGITAYEYARMPLRTATITVTGTGSVTGVTVGGNQILSATATNIISEEPGSYPGSKKSVAANIADKINACTSRLVGNCTVIGYSAKSYPLGTEDPDPGFATMNGIVTIYAPAATTATPVVTGGSTSATAFSAGGVPGETLFVSIVPAVNSYPYPGSATKATDRTDCAGTTCTYVEEMTNFANWYAYYRTRMQTMKTAASIAFSAVPPKFRIGYFSLNNASGSDFLNVGVFETTHRDNWYAKFLAAYPYGGTHLRRGLAAMGQYYAGASNGGEIVDPLLWPLRTGISDTRENVVDPVQYSCQQNYTILSTDGYWNDSVLPKKIDKATNIGQQDNNDPRPYYDGDTQTRVATQMLRTDTQIGYNSKLEEKMTQQRQSTTRQISQTVQATTTYDYQQQDSQLQKREKPLNQTRFNLTKTTYPLIQTPLVISENTIRYSRTSAVLNTTTNLLRERTTPVRQSDRKITKVSTKLQRKVTNITVTETPLIRSTSLLTKTTRKLQKRSHVSYNGGDLWVWTGWTDVTSGNCVAGAISPPSNSGGVMTDDVQCQYVIVSTDIDQASCNSVAMSTGPTYSQLNPVQCAYQGWTTETAVGSFTDAAPQTAGPNYVKAISYAYGSAGTPLTGQTSCSAQAQSTASPWIGPARTCVWDATPTSASDVTSGTCTATIPASPTSTKTECLYAGTQTTDTNQDSCTNVAGSTANPYSVLTRVVCSRQSASAKAVVTTCTAATTGASRATNPGAGDGVLWETSTTCTQDGTTTTTGSSLNSCTFDSGITGAGPTDFVYTAKKFCEYSGTSVAAATGSPPTCTVGSASTGTTHGTVWNSYKTCGWAAATTTGTDLNSCTPSGSGSGSVAGTVYTGPLVQCANQAATSVINPSCVASSPNPPVPLYSSPIVTCTTVADTANATTVLTCQNSSTVQCSYGAGVPATNQPSCKPQSQTPVAGVYTGPAVDCTYVNAGTTVETSCNVVAQVADGTGTFPGPAYSCAYGSYGAWVNVTSGNCTWANDSAGPTSFTGPSRECRYNPTTTTNVGTCTAVPGSSGSNTGDQWTVLSQRVCNLTHPVVVGPLNTSTVGNCVSGTVVTLPNAGESVSTQTTCSWIAASPVNVPACTPSGGESPVGTFNTEVTCAVTNLDPTPANGIDDRVWVPTASCADTGGVFDASGKYVECRETDLTVYNASYPSGPVPVATCTGGTDPGTKVQTTCAPASSMPLTKPTEPVATCVSASPLAPDYVTVTCTPNNSSSVVMGCTPQAASAPLWQEITCAPTFVGSEDLNPLANTLADVAAYYYKTDLRSMSRPASCTGALGLPLCTATDPMNNVPTTAADPNSAQHMTTFTLGLGASGYMRYSKDYATETSGDFYTVKGVSPYLAANGIAPDSANGICSWQSSGVCNWPVPASAEQTTIDDLWHAGVNGRGAYFSATNAKELTEGLKATLAQVAAQSAVAAAATVSNPVLTPGDSYVFSGTYKTVEWSGDVMRITLDPFSGLPNSTIDWSAQAKLDARVAARNIYTFDSGVATTKLKAFTAANFGTNAYFNSPNINTLSQFLCSNPTICLSATNKDSSHAAGANLVNYLRGERTNEGAETDNDKYYRARTHVLGDIVNAQVTYVTKPLYNYADPGYEAFRTAKASRQAVAYAAANDGMLHAIAAKGSAATEALVVDAANKVAAATLDPSSATKVADAAAASTAATAAIASDSIIGQEMWAYIPTMVMPNLYLLADKKYQDLHRYYVDATPVVGDICTSNCGNAATAVWKTILVGGLGGGGRGYYALDITDPASPKALWEFTDANLGYTYGTPQIAKMSNGTWVVLMTSGYNNHEAGGDGVGRLYVVNADTGVQISGVSPISTGVGAGVGSGLVKITAPVISPATDATVVAVYGGDLLGNLWRFDINDEVGASGVEAQLFAVLKDGSGNTQPITTRPIVTLAQKKYLVIVGTGQFLDTTDAAVANQQTLYGLIDHRASGTTASTAIYDNPGGAPRLTNAGVNTNGFVMQKLTEETCPTGAPTYLCTTGQLVMTGTNVQLDYNVNHGWFVDLIQTSERANLDPALALGTLVFNTNAPTTAACDLGGKSYQYWLDYKNGGAIQAPGTMGLAGKFLDNSLVNAPTLFTTDSGLRVGTQKPCVGPDCFKIQEPPIAAEGSLTRRTSWRELIRLQ